MSFYLLAGIVGILGGAMILIVIFSLLTLAQKGDAHLDLLGLGEAGGQFEDQPVKLGEGQAEPPSKGISQEGGAAFRASS